MYAPDVTRSEDTEPAATSVTEGDVEDFIVHEEVYDVGKKSTVVVLTLRNGFEIVASSSCVDPANYSQATGAKYARQTAVKDVWKLLGFQLQTRLSGQ